PGRPERLPAVLRLDPILGADRELIGIARRGRVARAVDVRAYRGAALGRGPELVPAPHGAIERHRLLVDDRDVADAGADVHVALGAERLQVLLDAGILAERLNERADGVLHHRAHLVV